MRATGARQGLIALASLFTCFVDCVEASNTLPKAPLAVRIATPDLADTLYPSIEDYRSVKFGAASNARWHSTTQEESTESCARALCINIAFLSAFVSDPFLLSGYDSQYELSSPTFDGLQYEMLQPVVEPLSTIWTFETDFKSDSVDGVSTLPTVELLLKLRQLSNFHSSKDQLLLHINARLVTNQTSTTAVEVYNVYGSQKVRYRTERTNNFLFVTFMIERSKLVSTDDQVAVGAAPLVIFDSTPSSCDECVWILSQCKLSEPCRRLLPCLLTELNKLAQREGSYDATSNMNRADLLGPLGSCVQNSKLASWAPIAEALACAARLQCNLGANSALDQTVLRLQEGIHTLFINSSGHALELRHQSFPLQISSLDSSDEYAFDALPKDALPDFLNTFITQSVGEVSMNFTELDLGFELALIYASYLLLDMPEIILNDSLSDEQQRQAQGFFEYSGERSAPSLENIIHELTLLVNSSATEDGNTSWTLSSECVHCSSLLFECSSSSITDHSCGYNEANSVFAQCLSDQLPPEVFTDIIQESAGSTGAVVISPELAECTNVLDREFDLSSVNGINMATEAKIGVNSALSCFINTQCPFGPVEQVSDSHQVQLYASKYVQILRISVTDFDLLINFYFGDHVFASVPFVSSSVSIIDTLHSDLDSVLGPTGITVEIGVFEYEVNSASLLVELEYINVALPGFSVSVTSRSSGIDDIFDTLLVYKNSQMIVQAPRSPIKIYRPNNSSVENNSSTPTPTPSTTPSDTVNASLECIACADRYLYNDCRKSAFCQEIMLPCVAEYLDGPYLSSSNSIIDIRLALEECMQQLSNSVKEAFNDWWEPLQNYFACFSRENCATQSMSSTSLSTLQIEPGSIEFVYASTSNTILQPNFQFSLDITQTGPGNSFSSDSPFSFYGDKYELARVLEYMTQNQVANITVVVESLFVIGSDSESGSSEIEVGVGSASDSYSASGGSGGSEAGFGSSSDSASRSDGGDEAGVDMSSTSTSHSGSGEEAGVSSGSTSNSQSGSGDETGVVAGSTSYSQSGSGDEAGVVAGSTSSSQSGSGDEAGVVAGSTSSSQSGSGDEAGVVAGSTSNSQSGSGDEAGVVAGSTSNSQSGSGDEAGVAGSRSSSWSNSGDDAGIQDESKSSSQSGSDDEAGIDAGQSRSKSDDDDAGITQGSRSSSQTGSGDETGFAGASTSSSRSSDSNNDAGVDYSSNSSSQGSMDENETGIDRGSASSSHSGSGNEAGVGSGSSSSRTSSNGSSSDGDDSVGTTGQVRVRIAYNYPFLGFIPIISGLQVTSSSALTSQPKIFVEHSAPQIRLSSTSDWSGLRTVLNEAAQATTLAATCSECEETFHYECSINDDCWYIVVPCLLSELSSQSSTVTYGSDINILETLRMCASKAPIQNAQIPLRLLSCYESRQCNLGGDNSTAPTFVRMGSRTQRFRLTQRPASENPFISPTIYIPDSNNSGVYGDFVGHIQDLPSKLLSMTQASNIALLSGGETSELDSFEFELEYTGYIGSLPEIEYSRMLQVSTTSREFAVVFTPDNARYHPSMTRLLEVLERE